MLQPRITFALKSGIGPKNYCFAPHADYLPSFEAGNHPTEASKWAAQAATKADGEICALREVVDALAGVERPEGSGAQREKSLDKDIQQTKKDSVRGVHGGSACDERGRVVEERSNGVVTGFACAVDEGRSTPDKTNEVNDKGLEGGGGNGVEENQDGDGDDGDGDDSCSEEEYDEYEDEFDDDEGGNGEQADAPRVSSGGNDTKRPKPRAYGGVASIRSNNQEEDVEEEERAKDGFGVGRGEQQEQGHGVRAAGEGGRAEDSTGSEDDAAGAADSSSITERPADDGGDQELGAGGFNKVPAYFLGGVEVREHPDGDGSEREVLSFTSAEHFGAIVVSCHVLRILPWSNGTITCCLLFSMLITLVHCESSVQLRRRNFLIGCLRQVYGRSCQRCRCWLCTFSRTDSSCLILCNHQKTS